MSKIVYLSDVKRTLLEMSKEKTRSVGWGDVLMDRLKESSFDIVHCKDCKFKRLYDGETKYFYCALENRPNRNWSVDEWNFCWWGERIEE